MLPSRFSIELEGDAVLELAVEIGGGEDGEDARHLAGLGRVDAGDAAVGDGAADEDGVGGALGHVVVDVGAGAGEEAHVFLAKHALAGPELAALAVHVIPLWLRAWRLAVLATASRPSGRSETRAFPRAAAAVRDGSDRSRDASPCRWKRHSTPPREEPQISARWEAADAFRAGANARPGAEAFSILLPPPNVTGSLHMGHAFNHTLMDILTRWHRMRGHDVLWQPGLDHAGIATQMVVERELARAGNAGRRDMGREAFVAKVWEWKAQSGGTILEQSRRLGDSFDLSRNAFTMSGAPGAPAGEEGNFHDAVLRTFVAFYEKGLIFRGKRLVNWDPHFETAISDLEVEQVEQKGNLWRLRYALEKGETYEHPVAWDEEGRPTAFETRDYLVVATTRPETMLGDTGVAVHPDDARYAHLVGQDGAAALGGAVDPHRGGRIRRIPRRGRGR